MESVCVGGRTVGRREAEGGNGVGGERVIVNEGKAARMSKGTVSD